MLDDVICEMTKAICDRLTKKEKALNSQRHEQLQTRGGGGAAAAVPRRLLRMRIHAQRKTHVSPKNEINTLQNKVNSSGLGEDHGTSTSWPRGKKKMFWRSIDMVWGLRMLRWPLPPPHGDPYVSHREERPTLELLGKPWE